MKINDQYKIADYYPVAVGNTWTYMDDKNKVLSQTVSEIVYLDDVTIEKFVTTEGKTVYVKGNEGLNAFKIKMKAVELSYAPPISMSPQLVSINENHSYNSRVTMKIMGIKFNLGYLSGTTILKGEEDIAVPAGKFNNCLRFESEASQKILFFNIQSKLTVWFAWDTGGIRYDSVTKFAGMTFKGQQVLTHAKLGNRSLPV